MKQKDYEKIEKIKSVNPTSFQNYVRTHFLEIAAQLYPEVFIELRSKALPLYIKGRLYILTNPVLKPNFSWENFENGTDVTSKNRIKLRNFLIDWQQRWGLIEEENSDKWIFRWLVKDLLNFWLNSSKILRKNKIVQRVKNRKPLIENSTIRKRKSLPIPPTLNPPGLIEFNQLTKLQNVKKASDIYIKKVLGDYRKRLETYCREVEEYIAENGWVEKEDVSLRDLIWTARSQIGNLDFTEIGNKGNIILINRNKKSSELQKDDFDIKSVEPSTVKRAVEKTLKILGLEKRKKSRGRRKGKRQDEINKQLMN